LVQRVGESLFSHLSRRGQTDPAVLHSVVVVVVVVVVVDRVFCLRQVVTVLQSRRLQSRSVEMNVATTTISSSSETQRRDREL